MSGSCGGHKSVWRSVSKQVRESVGWRKTTRAVSLTWSPLAIIAAWELLSSTRVLEPLFFPAPSTLVQTGSEMIQTGELQRHLQTTLKRMLQGFVLGTTSGIVCGLAMGAIPVVRHALDPLISALWTSPKLTLLPMLIIIIGIGEAPKILLIAVGCFIVVALYTLDGVRGVNRGYVDLARNYGANHLAILRKVYLPAVSPAVFTATRLALGRALTLTVSVELLNSREGLGYLVYVAWQSFRIDRLYIAVVLTAGLGMLFHVSLCALEKRLLTWREIEQG